jgi:hypothetical protein
MQVTAYHVVIKKVGRKEPNEPEEPNEPKGIVVVNEAV